MHCDKWYFRGSLPRNGGSQKWITDPTNSVRPLVFPVGRRSAAAAAPAFAHRDGGGRGHRREPRGNGRDDRTLPEAIEHFAAESADTVGSGRSAARAGFGGTEQCAIHLRRKPRNSRLSNDRHSSRPLNKPRSNRLNSRRFSNRLSTPLFARLAAPLKQFRRCVVKDMARASARSQAVWWGISSGVAAAAPR